MNFARRWSWTALIVLCAILLRLFTWPNADTAWLLTVAEGMQTGAVLYRADQDTDERFELYRSALPDAPPGAHSASAPTRTVTRPAPR